MSPQDAALLDLLRALAAAGYDFTTPAPETHRRVLRRRRRLRAETLADVFGWNLAFAPGDVDPALVDELRRGGALLERGGRMRSALRVARVGEALFLHSAYPPRAADAVFFGPDSYRFAEFIRRETGAPPRRIVDVGAGAGVGGIVAARLYPQAAATLADVNPKALRLARINAAFAGVTAEFLEGQGLDPVVGEVDLVIANPPYMAQGGGRIYRDGGGLLGAGLSLAWAQAAVRRLSPGGRMLLYTGAAMVQGRDPLREALAAICAAGGCALRYQEIDPDVFPGSLAHPAYWGVERIAAVGAVLSRAA